MALDPSPTRAPVRDAHARLDAHFAAQLACAPDRLRQRGVAIVATDLAATDRQGRPLALLGVAPSPGGACVLACRPALVGRLQAALATLPAHALPPDPAWLEAARTVAAAGGAEAWSVRHIYVADAAGLHPQGVDPSIKIERWEPGAEPGAWLSRVFDGPCYVIRDGAGRVVAWAGVGRASEHAWEVEAATEPAYRGRGLATSLTLRATAEVLEGGRLAIWLADIDNTSAQQLIERLGFARYGYQVVAAGEATAG